MTMNIERIYPVTAACAAPARISGSSSPTEAGGLECASCRHRYCSICEECSATKQYSDYWICHCCSELNSRFPNPNSKEAPHGLG